MIQRLCFAFALALVGCGGSSPGGGGGSGGTGGGGSGGGSGGAAADLAMPADMTAGFCGGQACGAGTTCCVIGTTPSCMSSCPDGGLSAQCAKPSDCPGATAACCIAINNYMPQSVSCVSDGSQCAPNISVGGSGMDRACVTATDCTDNGGGMNLPDCCVSTQSSQHVCFSKALLAMFPTQLGPYFTCP